MPPREIRRARSALRQSHGGTDRRKRTRPVATLLVSAATLLASLACLATSAQAAPVPLGTSDSFAVLAGSTVTNTGASVISGDVGVSPDTAVTGFGLGTIVAPGAVHAGDSVAARAQADLAIAYDSAAARRSDATISADLAGRTLTRGVYTSPGSLSINGDLTLDAQGDPDAVFVFQAASTLLAGTSAPSHVRLIGGAQARNVFWQVASSATIGAGSTLAGSILARTSITLNTGASINGRALAQNGAVTLDTNTITRPALATSTPGAGTTTTPKSCAVRSTSRRPARPVLRSPRRGARVPAGDVRFTWRATPRASRYTLMVDRKKMNTGCATRATMRVKRGRHTWRVIAAGQGGKRSSRTRVFSASFSGTGAEEIRERLGLDVLGKSVVAEAERVTLKAAEAAAFKKALRGLAKVASKAGVLGFLADLGLSDGDLDCEQGPLYQRAKPVFAAAAAVIKRAARAGVGRQRAIVKEIAQVRKRIKGLKTFIAGNDTVKECSGPNKVALNTIKKLEPTLSAASARLARRAVQPSPEACSTAKKLLTKYASIFPKVNRGKQLDRKTKEKLDRLRKAKTIRSNDLPGSLMRKFPGELKGFTLKEIEELCK